MSQNFSFGQIVEKIFWNSAKDQADSVPDQVRHWTADAVWDHKVSGLKEHKSVIPTYLTSKSIFVSFLASNIVLF